MADLFERKRIRDGVKDCHRCELRSRCAHPIPFSGPSNPRLVVVGEAPTQAEDEAGVSFVGKPGDLLHSWLRRYGWNVDGEVAFLNAVSCAPNRTATKDEIDACQKNLYDQLAYLDCDRLLVLGGVAVRALRNQEIRVGEIRGLWWRPDRLVDLRPTWALATWHPEAVLRNVNLAVEARTDVHFLSLVTRDPDCDPLQFRGEFCVKCGDPTVDYHVDIPYCKQHLPRK